MRFALPGFRTRVLLVVSLVLSIASVAGLPSRSSGTTSSLHNTCALSAKDVPACGVLWGLFRPCVAVTGQSEWSAHYENVESTIGRRFDIVKNYIDWRAGHTFPDAADRKLADGGRV